jgi:hypothetical protein
MNSAAGCLGKLVCDFVHVSSLHDEASQPAFRRKRTSSLNGYSGTLCNLLQSRNRPQAAEVSGPSQSTLLQPRGVISMIRTVVLAVAFACAGASAIAQTTPAAKPAAKAPAKKAAPAPVVLAPADQAQLDAAERTYFGAYECDFKQSIDVGMNPKTPGYVDVKFGKTVYTMKPVLSSTGALRLEDVKGVGLLIQIANKSMLMDTKAGKRLVDDCVHEKQRAAHDANK